MNIENTKDVAEKTVQRSIKPGCDETIKFKASAMDAMGTIKEWLDFMEDEIYLNEPTTINAMLIEELQKRVTILIYWLAAANGASLVK